MLFLAVIIPAVAFCAGLILLFRYLAHRFVRRRTAGKLAKTLSAMEIIRMDKAKAKRARRCLRLRTAKRQIARVESKL